MVSEVWGGDRLDPRPSLVRFTMEVVHTVSRRGRLAEVVLMGCSGKVPQGLLVRVWDRGGRSPSWEKSIGGVPAQLWKATSFLPLLCLVLPTLLVAFFFFFFTLAVAVDSSSR